MYLRISRSVLLALCLLPVLVVASAAPGVAGAQVVVISFDAPGTGYLDPSPVTPVGGNPGTTLGEQRMIAAQFAATLWGATLNSDVTIFVGAVFAPQLCTPTGAVLGSAGTTFVISDFPGAAFANTWYHSALADSLSGVDQVPGFIDIASTFNSNIDDDPACLGGIGWYYGLDHQAGGQIDFLSVLSHEMGHGLGHANFVNEATGANFAGMTDIYSQFSLDNTTGLTWSQMVDAERADSALNCRNVAWNGADATAAAASFLQPGTPLLRIDSPAAIAGDYPVGAAAFGPPVGAPVSGTVVLADDGTGATADACEPLVNAAEINGNIALVDRGTCAFVQKAQNAEAAGAIAVIVADNVTGCPPGGLGGSAAIGIPSVRITQDDGNTLKSGLPGATATLQVDPSRLAGADAAGRPLIYAVDPVALGSSISHWDTSQTPNTLMEPFINADLAPSVSLDLSPGQMSDIGWGLMTSTMIEGCDTGIGLVPLLAAEVERCRLGAKNHGKFVSCVTQVGNELNKAGLISGSQKGQLTSCAGSSSLP